MQSTTRKARLDLLTNLAIESMMFQAFQARRWEQWHACNDKLIERRLKNGQTNSRLQSAHCAGRAAIGA